jgi:transposase-like protein
VPRNRRKFSPEFKDEAVKAVILNSRPIAQVARELSINEGTLGNWVAAFRRDHAEEEPALDVSERARLREAERLVRELKMENEFLKKVIMPAGAGTGDRMRIGVVARSRRRRVLVP